MRTVSSRRAPLARVDGFNEWLQDDSLEVAIVCRCSYG